MTNSSPQNKNGHVRQYVSTVVVSRPGMMRQSLQAMLAAYPWIGVVASAGDGLTAFNYVLRYQPELLIIDSNLLEEEAEALLAAAQSRSPKTRCLICVQSDQQEARLLAAGADAIIHRDSPPQQLHDALFRLTQASAN